MKKILIGVSSVFLTVSLCFPIAVVAEHDYSDTEYWNSLCTDSSSLSETDRNRCKGYADYIAKNNEALKNDVQDIKDSQQELSGNIQDIADEIQTYAFQISDINGMIQDLDLQISGLNQQIQDKQKSIEENETKMQEKQTEIDAMRDRIKKRMIDSQSTMRLPIYFDILMGAKSFGDFLLLADGLANITNRENDSIETLNALVAECTAISETLKSEKEELASQQADLISSEETLSATKADLSDKQAKASELGKKYESELKAANLDLSQTLAAISSNSSTIGGVSQAISNSELAESLKNQTASNSSPAETGNQNGSQTSSSQSSSSSESSSGSSNDWYQSGGTTAAGCASNPYYGGWANCTWGAWQLAHDIAGVSLPGWGNAGTWLWYAQRDGYATGSSPQVYSIMVFTGHVAFVTQIDGDKVYIKEGNYLGRYNERWVSVSEACGFVYL